MRQVFSGNQLHWYRQDFSKRLRTHVYSTSLYYSQSLLNRNKVFEKRSQKHAFVVRVTVP